MRKCNVSNCAWIIYLFKIFSVREILTINSLIYWPYIMLTKTIVITYTSSSIINSTIGYYFNLKLIKTLNYILFIL